MLTARSSRRDAVVVVVAIVIAAVLPAVVALLAGAGTIPRNDDWSFRGIADELYRTGSLRLEGAAQAFTLGQVVLVQPILRLLDGDPRSYWLVGTIAAAAAVAATYALARQRLGRFDAVLVVAALTLVPGYLAYSSSFMTEVPSMAAQLACLALGTRSVRGGRHDLAWAAAAIAIGAIGFSIRQFVVLAPIAVAVVGVAREPRRIGRWGIVAALGVLLTGITIWHESLPGQLGAMPQVAEGLRRLAASVPFVALAVLPVSARAVLLRPSSVGRVEVVVAMATVVLVTGTLLAFGATSVFLGNLVGPHGVPSDGVDIGTRPDVWTEPGWLALEALAILAIVPMALAIVRAVRAIAPTLAGARAEVRWDTLVLVVFLVLTVAMLGVYTVIWPTYDRYLWQIVVPLGVVLLSSVPEPRVDARPQRVVPIALTGLLAVVSVGYALNAYAFDAARWRMGDELVAAGYAPATVDAGYEWVGTYAPGQVQFADLSRRSADPVIWYGGIWPEFRRCAFVASSPVRIDGFELVSDVPDAYRLFLVAGPAVPLYLYGSTAADCGVDDAP